MGEMCVHSIWGGYKLYWDYIQISNHEQTDTQHVLGWYLCACLLFSFCSSLVMPALFIVGEEDST